MILGCYYLTLEKEGKTGEGRLFSNINEAMLAYDDKQIDIHARIKVRQKDAEGNSQIVITTAGRIIFNNVIPQDLGFVDRSKGSLDFEVGFVVGKRQLGDIVSRCIEVHGITETAKVLDEIKSLGFKFSTKGAITVSISDMEVPDAKAQEIAKAEERIEEIADYYKKGLITDDERYELVIKTWADTKDNVTNALMEHLDEDNPIYMMANSGARGSVAQISQLSGMRGLMADTQGKTVEIPVRANFREGLNVLEYFISTHGARKGLADTALRTADSGYMTRRLVDVSQDVIIRQRDCGTKKTITITNIRDNNEVIEELFDRLIGRFTLDAIKHPETGEEIVPADTLIDSVMARKVIDSGIAKVQVRSPLTCKAKTGLCAKCYGANLANNQEVNVGEAVGIIAAQSIGEPGTQLTMRTFHTGGVAGGDDITQGLPRVEELFEARKPKGLAIISDIPGIVSIDEDNRLVHVTRDDDTKETKEYFIPFGSRIKVKEGQVIEAGEELTVGSINPHDILRISGVDAVQRYLTREVQRVYRLQGVEINDRHIEVIVRQMLKKAIVEDSGDTDLISGQTVDVTEIEAQNSALESGKQPATYTNIILGITKASLVTDSFLSAASFQETTKVLTDAAIKGKTDPLVGLKENVILGKLIPAGTGLDRYRDIEVEDITSN